MQEHLSVLAEKAPINGPIPKELIGLATHFRIKLIPQADQVEKHASAPGPFAMDRLRTEYAEVRLQHAEKVGRLLELTRGLATEALSAGQHRLLFSAGLMLLLWSGALAWLTGRARLQPPAALGGGGLQVSDLEDHHHHSHSASNAEAPAAPAELAESSHISVEDVPPPTSPSPAAPVAVVPTAISPPAPSVASVAEPSQNPIADRTPEPVVTAVAPPGAVAAQAEPTPPSPTPAPSAAPSVLPSGPVDLASLLGATEEVTPLSAEPPHQSPTAPPAPAASVESEPEPVVAIAAPAPLPDVATLMKGASAMTTDQLTTMLFGAAPTAAPQPPPTPAASPAPPRTITGAEMATLKPGEDAAGAVDLSF